MRYRAIGENELEEQILASAAVPLPILDTILPQVQAKSIQVAVRLGIFTAIGCASRTAADLASSLGLHPESAELLLRVLTCADYLVRDRGSYRLTDVARRSLLPDSEQPQAAFVDFTYGQRSVLDNLEAVVRTGRGVDFHQQMTEPAEWEHYLRAQLDLARISAPRAAQLMPIREGARSLLDLAGGHGLYGALMCRLHPPMCSEVVDLPPAVAVARRLGRELGIDDVVRYRAGDILETVLGRDHDAVFIANTIHHFTAPQIRRLFDRINDALTPGGTVGIWDMRRPGADAERELGGDGFALVFRVTSTSQSYAVEELAEWLAASGFADIQVSPTPFGFMQMLVSARKP